MLKNINNDMKRILKGKKRKTKVRGPPIKSPMNRQRDTMEFVELGPIYTAN